MTERECARRMAPLLARTLARLDGPVVVASAPGAPAAVPGAVPSASGPTNPGGSFPSGSDATSP